MKYLVAIGALSMIAGPFYVLLGVRPFCDPYRFARSMPSAHDYWIEFEEQGKCGMRHKFGRKWLVDFDEWGARRNATRRYAGESGRLWQIRIPRIEEPFLLFDSCFVCLRA